MARKSKDARIMEKFAEKECERLQITKEELFTPGNIPDFNNMVLINEAQAVEQGLVRDELNIYHRKIQPVLELILSMRRDKGLTFPQIAKSLGITEYALEKYANLFPELLQVLMWGKELAIATIKNSLFETARGHTATVKKTKFIRSKSEDGDIVVTPVQYDDAVHYPASVPAMQFYLQHEDPSYNPKTTTVHEGEFSITHFMAKVGEKSLEDRNRLREQHDPSLAVTPNPFPALPDPDEKKVV